MDELSQILNCEEDNKNRLQKAKELAEREIEEKGKEVLEKISNQADLIDEAEKAKILAYKEKEIERVGQEVKKELDLKMGYLKSKREKYEKSTIDYVVKDFLNN